MWEESDKNVFMPEQVSKEKKIAQSLKHAMGNNKEVFEMKSRVFSYVGS